MMNYLFKGYFIFAVLCVECSFYVRIKKKNTLPLTTFVKTIATCWL